MHRPDTDTSEYAALVEFIASGGRSTASLKPSQDVSGVVRHALSERAKAMTQSLVTIARAALPGKH